MKVKGRAVPVSFINNVDPAFGVPHTTDSLPIYDAAEFPFDNIDCDSNGYHEWVAHFLCLAIKVSTMCMADHFVEPIHWHTMRSV